MKSILYQSPEESLFGVAYQKHCNNEDKHGFLDTDGKFVRLNKDYPEFYRILSDLAEAHKAEVQNG